MPPVIVAAIVGTSITTALIETAVSLVGTFVIAALTQSLASNPNASTATQTRTITVKEPLMPWKIVYGRARVGGAWVYIHTTGNPTIGQNSALMGAIVLCAHQVDAIEKIYFGDEEVKLDSSGNALGKYRNYVHIFKHLGIPGDPADANLIRWGDGTWTSAHTLSGMAYLSIDLAYNQDLFPSMPVISAVVRGKQLVDYRDGGTRWSDNPVLCMADFLVSTTYGMGYAPYTDIDLANFNAEASHCEELVQSAPIGGGFRMPQDAFTATPSLTWKPNAFSSKTLSNAFTINSDTLGFDTGDRVMLTGNALPPGVVANTPYWVIRIADGQDYIYQAFNINRTPVIQLATSHANAVASPPVPLTITGNGSGTVWMLDDMWSLDQNNKNLQTGDLVQIYWDGTNPLPAPLVNGGSYYYIDHGKGNLYYETSHQLIAYGHGTLAWSQAQAIANQPITFTSTCIGNFVIYKQYEKRFTCNGVVDTSASPNDILGQLLGSCGGKLVRAGQKWRVFTAVWRGYTSSLDESYLRSAIKVDTLVSRRDLFNGVRGTFISNMNYDQPSDFPPYPNPLRPDLDIFLAEDGERIWSPDISLPFTNTGSMAQRLAKILLMQIRKQITLVFPATLKAFGVTVGEVVLVNLTSMGWANKPFEIVDWALRMDAGGDGVPIPGIDITLRETDPAVFDWSNGAETTGWWAGRTTLPYVHLVPTPQIVSVSEYLYVPSTGAGRVSGVNVAWNPVLDGFVGYYQVGYYVSPGTGVIGNENIQSAGSGTENNVQPLAAKSTYCFVVRAINIFGVASPWSPAVCLAVRGITAIPPDLTNFRVEAINNQAHVTWTASPDLDVQNGGHIQLRWTQTIGAGAQWPTSTAFILSLAGTATEATIMLKAGTYFAKAIDSAGNASTNAVSWVVPAVDKPGWQDLITTTESPTYPGTKTNLVVSSGNLQLATIPGSSSQVDSWASVDAIADWDNEGGVLSDGEYDYSVITDLGAKFGFRIDLAMTQAQIGLSVFGDMAPSKTYAQIATTNDPPLTGSPVWTDWSPLIMGDFIGRGIKRRVMFHTDDPHSSVAVSLLADTISMFQRMWTQQGVSLAAAGTRVNYSQAFYSSPPSVGGNVFGGAIGDYVIATARDRSGATFTIYSSAGTAKAGTADLYAFGPGSQIP